MYVQFFLISNSFHVFLALEITPDDIKALFRRCQAYEQLEKFNEALEDARAVIRLNPKNSAIQPIIKRLEEIVSLEHQNFCFKNKFTLCVIILSYNYGSA